MNKFNSSGSAGQGSATSYASFFGSWKSSIHPRRFTFVRIFMASLFIAMVIFDAVMYQSPNLRFMIFGFESCWIYVCIVAETIIMILLAILSIISYKYYVDIEVKMQEAMEIRFEQDIKIEQLRRIHSDLCAELSMQFMGAQTFVMQTYFSLPSVADVDDSLKPALNGLIRVGNHMGRLYKQFHQQRNKAKAIACDDNSFPPLEHIHEVLNQIDSLHKSLRDRMGIFAEDFEELLPQSIHYQPANAISEMLYVKFAQIQKDFLALTTAITREGKEIGNTSVHSLRLLRSVSAEIENISEIVASKKSRFKDEHSRDTKEQLQAKMKTLLVTILPWRVAGRLRLNGIETVDDLLMKSKGEVMSIRGIGRKSMNQICDALESLSPVFRLENR